MRLGIYCEVNPSFMSHKRRSNTLLWLPPRDPLIDFVKFVKFLATVPSHKAFCFWFLNEVQLVQGHPSKSRSRSSVNKHYIWPQPRKSFCYAKKDPFPHLQATRRLIATTDCFVYSITLRGLLMDGHQYHEICIRSAIKFRSGTLYLADCRHRASLGAKLQDMVRAS